MTGISYISVVATLIDEETATIITSYDERSSNGTGVGTMGGRTGRYTYSTECTMVGNGSRSGVSSYTYCSSAQRNKSDITLERFLGKLRSLSSTNYKTWTNGTLAALIISRRHEVVSTSLLTSTGE